ncbi:MAG: hypothetical protein CVV44_20650 [Spirochaetae bacterium HGW-Spirochaetae-1]|nr:MAG: hypothetical protein CVV44_20650 [Spirochaetae bacterium HGW-Spirochaetae-1]
MQIVKLIFPLIFLALSGESGCERADLFNEMNGPAVMTDAKAITSFSFTTLGITATIDDIAYAITATVPYGTDVTAMVASFATTGASVHIGATLQISGSTPNDFSSPVTYTVTAGDGSMQDYSVTVNIAAGTPYEILHDTGSNSAWFGGDANYAGGRNVGQGQSVLIDQDIILESFSISMATPFANNVDSSTGDVTLRLIIRNAGGVMLDSIDLVVPASYSGGWITWTPINMSVASGTTLIFTAYLVGGYDTNELTAYIDANLVTDSYSNGRRYDINGAYTDAAMETWSNWGTQDYDLHFWLQGMIP